VATRVSRFSTSGVIIEAVLTGLAGVAETTLKGVVSQPAKANKVSKEAARDR
jgi:hypothetical protein